MLKLGKGWRRWLMIGFLVILGALAVLAFTTGCSKAAPATTTTPLQALQNDMDDIEDTVDQLVISDASNGNSISVLETWKTGIETWKASVNEKIANLESGGIPEIDLSDMEAEIAMLDLRLIWIENMVANGSIVSPTATPTATGTPTPTPTPIVYCGIHRPSAVYPTGGDVNVQNGSVLFQWTEAINAVRYEFWFGTDSSSMTKVKEIDDFSVTNYLHPVPLANTYYFWKIVVRDACGNVQTDSWWFKTLP